MRIRRFAKVLAAFLTGVLLAQLVYACSPRSQAAEKTKLTIATVNNGDMVVMQGLSRKFESANPDIQLRWVVRKKMCYTNPQLQMLQALVGSLMS